MYSAENSDPHFQPHNSDTDSILPAVYKFKDIVEFKQELKKCKSNLFNTDLIASAINKLINGKMEKYIDELVIMIEKNSSEEKTEKKIKEGLEKFGNNRNSELIKLLSRYKCVEQQKEVKHNFGMTIAELEKSTDILTGITPGFSR